MLDGHNIEEVKRENEIEIAQNLNEGIAVPVEEEKQDEQIVIVEEDHNDAENDADINMIDPDEEMKDEVLNLLMSSAQDQDDEINARQKKSDRKSVASPCVSRGVFKIAKKVGVQVSFD